MNKAVGAFCLKNHPLRKTNKKKKKKKKKKKTKTNKTPRKGLPKVAAWAPLNRTKNKHLEIIWVRCKKGGRSNKTVFT